MDHYSRKRKDILQQRPRMTPYLRTLKDSEEEIALSVFTTWELSLQQLRAESDSGDLEANVLTLFAFLGGKDLSAQLFEAYCSRPHLENELPKYAAGSGLKLFLGPQGRWDADNFDSVVISLSQTSLVQAWFRGSDGYCHVVLHPLIEDWIMVRVDLPTFWKYHVQSAEVLAAILEASYLSLDFQIPFAVKMSILSRIDLHLEHGNYLEMQGETSSTDKYGDLQRSHLWFYRVLHRDFRDEDAAPLAKKVFEWRERVLGPEDESTVDVLSDMSNFYGQPEGEEMSRRYIRSCETLYGHDHILTFRGYWGLCGDLLIENRFEELGKIFEKEIKSFRELFGPECADTCFSLWMEGAFFQQQGLHGEAEVTYRQMLEIADKILFPAHYMAILVQKNLVKVLKLQGKEHEARDVRQSYAEHLNSRFNSMHNVAVELQIEIASDLFDQERYIEAEIILQPLINDEATVYAHNALAKYSDVLRALDKYEEAEELFLHRFAMQAKRYGPESLEAAFMLEHLSVVLRDRKRIEECVSLARRVLAIRLKERGPHHSATSLSYRNLGYFLGLQGKYPEAIDLLQECYRSKVEHFGPDHQSTTKSLKDIADLHYDYGVTLLKEKSFLQGATYLQQAYEVRAKHLGEEHKATRKTLEQIAWAYYDYGNDLMNQEKHKEALEFYVLCYKLEADVAKVDVKSSPYTLRQIRAAATALHNSDRYLEALEISKWVLEAQEKHLGPDHEDTITTLSNMVKSLNFLKRPSEAQKIAYRVIKSQELNLGPEHPDVVETLFELCRSYKLQENWSEAEKICRRGLKLNENHFPSDGLVTISYLRTLQYLLGKRDELIEREEVLRSIVESRNSPAGFAEDERLFYYRLLAEVLRKAGNETEAKKVDHKIIETEAKISKAEAAEAQPS